MFLEKLLSRQEKTLIDEMRIHPHEDFFDNNISYWGSRLHVVHHEEDDEHGQIESIYADFKVEMLYNCTQLSRYDQKKYRNVMGVLFGDAYKKALKQYFKEHPEEE